MNESASATGAERTVVDIKASGAEDRARKLVSLKDNVPNLATAQVHWRLLLSSPMNGPQNMALDHALMARARTSREAVLRIYSWNCPVLSLGRNQRAIGVYREDELRSRGISVVRRPTGGRALLHCREVTYSVTAPAANRYLGPTYQRINALLMKGLAALGVPAMLAE